MDPTLMVRHPFRPLVRGLIKHRPCIIVSLPEEEGARDGNILIYVMATYGDTKFQDLPFVYQHFSVAVYPNITLPTGHIHFKPEWRSRGDKPQWIIAYPVPILPRDLESATRWSTIKSVEDSVYRSHHRLEPVMYTQLRGLARRRLKKWSNMCAKDKELSSQARLACAIPSWVGPFSA